MVEGVGLGFRVQGSGFRVHRIQGGFGVKKRFARPPRRRAQWLGQRVPRVPGQEKEEEGRYI